MKLLFIALTFLSIPAFAGKTEIFRCDGEFIFPSEADENKMEVMKGEMTVYSENGQETTTVSVAGTLIAENQPVQRRDNGKPELDMVEQMKETGVEYPEFAKVAKDLYGSKIEDTLKNTVSTTHVGFEADDMGAILGHHYDSKGNMISTEMCVAWAGCGFCK